MAIFVSEGEEVASVNMVSPDCSDLFRDVNSDSIVCHFCTFCMFKYMRSTAFFSSLLY